MTPSEHSLKILQKNNLINQIPVDVYAIAKNENITIIKSSFDNAHISALLVFKDGKYYIGVNESHPDTRQRFSIAHELGHYFIHRKMFHLDAEPVEGYIMYRDENSETGTDPKEREANEFAANLLMPEGIFRLEAGKEFASYETLAQKFNVSKIAITIRCNKLGIILNES